MSSYAQYIFIYVNSLVFFAENVYIIIYKAEVISNIYIYISVETQQSSYNILFINKLYKAEVISKIGPENSEESDDYL